MAGNRPDLAVGKRDRFAQGPEFGALRVALGDDAIADQPGIEGIREQRFQPFGWYCPSGQAQVNQHHPVGRRGEGLAHLRQGFGQKAQARAADKLESRQPLAKARLRHGQKRERRARAFDHDQRGPLLRGAGIKPQACRRDDAQSPFGPDQKMAQVVASIVLAQPLQSMPDRSIGHDRFQPQHQIARIAVAQHIDPACIGPKQATNPRRSFGGEREWEQPPGGGCRRLNLGQDRTGFGN